MRRALSSRIKSRLLACLFIVGMLHSQSTSAGEIEYQFFPYVWTSGLDAETGPPARTTSVDVSFSDYVGYVDAGLAFVFEAKGDTWSFTSDVLAVTLSEDIELPASTADYENDLFLLELAVGYRPSSWKAARIVVGARYLKMDNTILFRDQFEVVIGQSWVDPFVGVEWRPRRGNWELLVESDIGGGVEADFTWAFIVGGTYHFGKRFGLGAAYRFIDIDFADNEFVFDGTMEGLQIGLAIKF